MSLYEEEACRIVRLAKPSLLLVKPQVTVVLLITIYNITDHDKKSKGSGLCVFVFQTVFICFN